jgi:hypothetical protein
MEKLQKWGRDASSIFEGDQLFVDIPVLKDDVYESLFDDCDPELDTDTDGTRIIVSQHTSYTGSSG